MGYKEELRKIPFVTIDQLLDDFDKGKAVCLKADDFDVEVDVPLEDFHRHSEWSLEQLLIENGAVEGFSIVAQLPSIERHFVRFFLRYKTQTEG